MKIIVTMKKVKQIKEMRHEQQRLSGRQAELKELIHADWIEVKEAAKLKNILKNRLRCDGEKKGQAKKSWIESLCGRCWLVCPKDSAASRK
jgi:ferredoxin